MEQYYTTIEISNKGYIGLVFNKNTNEKIYKTKEYSSQNQAVQDLNIFLKTKTASQTPITPKAPQIIVNTITTQSFNSPSLKRCCGR